MVLADVKDGVVDQALKHVGKSYAVEVEDVGDGGVAFFGADGGIDVAIDNVVAAGLVDAKVKSGIVVHAKDFEGGGQLFFDRGGQFVFLIVNRKAFGRTLDPFGIETDDFKLALVGGAEDLFGGVKAGVKSL